MCIEAVYESTKSSQAAKYGGCFTGEDTVTTPNGVKKSLSELQIGEKILSFDTSSKKLVFSEVILFLDYDPLQKRKFLTIFLASGRTFTVTSNHLLLVGNLKYTRTVYAEKVKIGDSLLVSKSNGTIFEDNVLEIKTVMKTGVYAPLTQVGTIVVNDMIASCYATIDSQYLAHWAFLPLRLVWNIKQNLYSLWYPVKKPSVIWSRVSPLVTLNKPSIGVHWYAKILYTTASYFLPSHLHK
ncbi:protein hedgehog-like [Anoplophora glabripennis]|uniref:protein hedgehog-like n=1 Tax=Anoplophora glabripennis TaxID=217634 RepID=UPI000874B9A6|nr:protein hedgehog-like [Anoplophora glabripennis]XP_023311501.1 protein hedgehog-like [Anoplophora glabripennis]